MCSRMFKKQLAAHFVSDSKTVNSDPGTNFWFRDQIGA